MNYQAINLVMCSDTRPSDVKREGVCRGAEDTRKIHDVNTKMLMVPSPVPLPSLSQYAHVVSWKESYS